MNWNALKEEEYAKAYSEWMATESNSHNCANCPHAHDCHNWQERADRVEGPCGQQHCWVDVTCYSEDF